MSDLVLYIVLSRSVFVVFTLEYNCVNHCRAFIIKYMMSVSYNLQHLHPWL